MHKAQKMPNRATKLLILAVAIGLLLMPNIGLRSQEPPSEPPELPSPEEPHILGTLEGIGTYFELTDSEYLNVFIQSSEEITILLESVPEMISINIESPADSTTLTIGNFEPNKSYYKFEDSYKNETVFITNEEGTYTYVQDLSQPHHVWFQEENATVFIPEDCSTVGIWDAQTSTCTLTQDLTESVEITADNITLDGNGHSIMGLGGYGIYLRNKERVTIRNCIIGYFTRGIYLSHSNNNTLTDNTANSNYGGIFLSSSINNLLTGNTVNSNNRGISLYYASDNNILTANTANSNFFGIYLYSSDNNTLAANTANSNYSGISLGYSDNNILTGNTANSNYDTGIPLHSSKNNTLTSNTANSNDQTGISLSYSDNNILTGNTANSNRYGISFYCASDNNSLADNTFSNNRYGIHIYYFSYDNLIYNNYFNNTNNFYLFLVTRNFWNITKTAGINIVGGPYLSGNFWAKPNGTGFSQTCEDADGDGICDSIYTLASGNVDYLPLTFLLNRPPEANANGPYVGDEGSPITFDGSASSDPDGDELQYRWDFDNNGSWDTAWLSVPTATYTWDDDWSGTAKLEVTDGQLTDSAIADVTVNNVSPIANIDEILPSQEVFAGDEVSFFGSFTDPGWLDTHIIEWDFGDGDTAAGLAATHIYYKQDSYSVTFTVTDDDGGVDIATAEMIVKPIPATIDFKPDTLNLKSKGKWVTVYIELAEDYDVSLIDINTVLFNGQIPAENDPKYDFVAEPEIKDRDNNGLPELMVKFDKSEVQSILSPGEEVTITVTGGVFYNDGLTDFEGSDIIRVIDKKK
jgi:parallel beta-helix repeat protein